MMRQLLITHGQFQWQKERMSRNKIKKKQQQNAAELLNMGTLCG